MSARHWFRRALRLLPLDFRSDYGRDMEQTFRDQELDASGPLERLAVWILAFGGVMAIGPREHVHQLRQDIRYALRGMIAAPAFSAVVVTALGLALSRRVRRGRSPGVRRGRRRRT